MKKKQLIEENKDLKRRLQFFIMITELNKTPIPEELYKNMLVLKKKMGQFMNFSQEVTLNGGKTKKNIYNSEKLVQKMEQIYENEHKN
jgi:hypothetical protein